MKQFSLKASLIAFVNNLFGADIKDVEEMDDPTAFTELKEVIQSNTEKMKGEIDEMKEKISGLEEAQKQITQLNTDLKTHQDKVTEMGTTIATMKIDHAKQLTDLKDVVRAEILKKGKESGQETTTDLDDKTKPKSKTQTINAWDEAYKA